MVKIVATYIILIVSILFIFLTIVLFFLRNKSWVKELEKNIKKISNILTFTSVLLAILAISITAIITIATEEKAKIQIGFYTNHGALYSEESGKDELYLNKDENGKISKPISVPLDWKIRLTNHGNISTKNMLVRIEFDGIYFQDETNTEYEFTNPIYGNGGYQAIKYKLDQDLYPNDFMYLPEIPFESMQLEDETTESVNMKITLYDENNTSKEFNFDIQLEGEIV